MSDKARRFAALHISGDPLVLFNIWDAGSAQAVANAGAKAVATGSVSVAQSNGYGDGEQLPLELALANAARIVAAVDLPVTIDFEGGYASDVVGVETNLARLAATGAIGCNFEDQIVGTDNIYPVAEQQRRIAAARRGAGADFFINARTDLFLKSDASSHGGFVSEAIDRAKAYADAGASGYFIPGLGDLALVERISKAVELPVNAMHFPGAPSRAQWAAAGIARISHGPFPFLAMQKWLEEEARAAAA